MLDSMIDVVQSRVETDFWLSGAKPPPISVSIVVADFTRQLAAVGSSDGLVVLWTIGRQTTCLGMWQAHEDAVRSAAMGGKPLELLTGGRAGTLCHWDMDKQQLLGTFAGHSGDVLGVVADFERRRACSGAGDGCVKVWDLDVGTQLFSFDTLHDGQITGVAAEFDTDHFQLASWGIDGTLGIWQKDSTVPIRNLRHNSPSMAAAVDFNHCKAVIGCLDGSVVYRSWRKAQCDETVALPSEPTSPPSEPHEVEEPDSSAMCRPVHPSADVLVDLPGHDGCVRSVAANFDRNLAVSGSYDRTIQVWDLLSLTCRAVLRGHEGWVLSVCVAWDENLILSGSTDSKLRFWDLERGVAERGIYACAAHVDAYEVMQC